MPTIIRGDKFFFICASVFMAIFIWFYVLGTETVVIEKEVPLIVEVPDEKYLSQQTYEFVTFTLKGPKAFIRSVEKEEKKILIDLKKVAKRSSSNSFSIKINKNDLITPFGIEVEKVTPNSVAIKLEKMVTKKLRIKPLVEDDLNLYRFGLNRMVPATVLVKGPRSLLKRRGQLTTKEVPARALLGQTHYLMELDLPKGMELSPNQSQTVGMEYSLVPRAPNIRLKKVPIVLQEGSSFRTLRRTAFLEAFSPDSPPDENILKQLKVVGILDAKKKGKQQVNLQIKLPGEVYLMKLKPQKIFVTAE